MTITSFTDSTKSYETTDHDCTCGDWMYRGSKTGKPCKHMIARLVALEAFRAVTFLRLFAKYDCRANGDETTHRCNYELSLAS